MKVGLYFGTYNPIHVGHLIIANYMAQFTDLDQVWMVVTPQNPMKKNNNLLADYHRLAMVQEALEDNDLLQVSDIEFKLPKPSYTINTLVALEERHPTHQFSLIMGEDNLRTLHKWKNFEEIIKGRKIYVYPRALTEEEQEKINRKGNRFIEDELIELVNAPIMKISSSLIRRAIKDGKDVRYLLTEPVYKYLTEMNFYK
ncbi:MAG: nicotinic acid mononucleotide adenylyltransferase [Crocinitomicaceae bacterium]|nr:nicotinic acid mononucleotide adenylyltransferase [Crocinitomicaceae bacterium]|tara:strand:+ start:176 stop:775 length:600 start_codon:yes stop_codon:yes gene_type:complete